MSSKGQTLPDLCGLLRTQGFVAFTEMQRVSPEEFLGSFVLDNKIQCNVLGVGVIQFEPDQNMLSSKPINNTNESVDKKSADIVLSCGVHGNETGPIEMLASIIDKILSGTLSVGNRLLFLFGNPLAATNQQRFTEENLNRLFNGGHKNKNSYEANRAAILEKHVDDFFSANDINHVTRIHYDLHTAIRDSKYSQFIIYPYPDDADFDSSRLAFFSLSGINTVLLSHQPSNTFSYFTSHCYQAAAFTVELGKVKPFGENDPNDFKSIEDNLSLLISTGLSQFKTSQKDKVIAFSVKQELLKVSDQFVLNLPQEIKNFHQLSKGYQLTDDKDGGYTVQHDNEAIVFPNENVPIGQRAGLVVEKIIF